jgi:transposase-like protein
VATNPLVCLGPVPRGRPTVFSEEVAREIIERLWEGESLTKICRDEDMPSLTTVYRWRDAYPDFRADYAEARARQADTFADRMQDVAEDLALLPEHKRLILDTMKWRAARQNWRAWGDKVQHEVHNHNHAAAGQEQLPSGLEWLAGQLPSAQPAAGPGPDHSDVGEE